MPTKTINTGIKLDETLHIRLKALAAIKDRSPHWLMRSAINEYVAREKAYEREKREDMERWRRYQSTGHSIAHEHVEVWLENIGTDCELPCPK